MKALSYFKVRVTLKRNYRLVKGNENYARWSVMKLWVINFVTVVPIAIATG